MKNNIFYGIRLLVIGDKGNKKIGESYQFTAIFCTFLTIRNIIFIMLGLDGVRGRVAKSKAIFRDALHSVSLKSVVVLG